MRQLSLPFPALFHGQLQARRIEPTAGLSLHRIEPGRNMARFYSMQIAQDLFGRAVLVRQWGRLGTFGHVRTDEHETEEQAAAALSRLIEAKRRRGYSDGA